VLRVKTLIDPVTNEVVVNYKEMTPHTLANMLLMSSYNDDEPEREI
jgi:hypothetical protein